jgi:hypothetical protein
MFPFRPLDIVGMLVVGRTVTIRLDSGDVTMTVAQIDARPDVRRLAVGHLDDVTVTVTDIIWGTSRFDRASWVLHNVRLLPGAPPVIVAAPVDVTLDVPTSALEHLFPQANPRLAGQVGPDGVVRLHWGRRPVMGQVEVDAELDGAELVLTARAVTFRRGRWRLPGWTPSYRVRLPLLPHGLELTGVEFEPELLRVRGTVPRWKMPIFRPG